MNLWTNKYVSPISRNSFSFACTWNEFYPISLKQMELKINNKKKRDEKSVSSIERNCYVNLNPVEEDGLLD